MPQLVFRPKISLLSISQTRLRVILYQLLFAFLILFGFYGLFILFYPLIRSLNLFYLSILSDMFLLYLWQRRKERIKKIGLFKPKGEIEISLFLDKSAQKSLEKAWLSCYAKRHEFFKPVHLFASFLKDKNFNKILKRLNCQPEEVIKKTKSILASPSLDPSLKGASILKAEITIDLKNVFFKAYYFCLEKNKPQISSLDILWAISQERNLVRMIFDEFGISSQEIEQVVIWAQFEQEIQKWEKSFFWQRIFKPRGKLDRAMIASLTPFLDKISQDLTELAKKGRFEMIIGRDKEIERIFNFFSAGKMGTILVGQGDIGKKAVLRKIAQLMVIEDVPRFLQDKRLIVLDLSSLVGLEGAREKGEEYLRRALLEVNRAGNIVLAIENVDNLAGLKSQASGLEFAEILASALEQQAFFFIGTALPSSFSSKIEGGLLGRVLNRVKILSPSRDLLWQILISKIVIIERELGILFSISALNQAIKLADRYIYGKALLSKAMDLLIEAGHLIKNRGVAGALVQEKDITDLVVQKTKAPLGDVEQAEKKKLLQLEKLIHKRLINQEEAVKAVSNALRRGRLETQDRKRPIANFLFIGPTGVGKTETAKALAQVYFNDEKRMIRLDMSEYQEKRSLRRLIGLQTDQGITKGYLTEAIKRQPHSLLLLDEIEKAHPDILNLFLQLMDDGRLTDVSGETINFTNIILIASSNAGTKFIQESIKKGVSYDEIYSQLTSGGLTEYFSPEFLNRFDKIILFRSLSVQNMVDITKIFLKEVKNKMQEKGIDFKAEQGAVEELAQAGFDPLYGARPLRRVIQDRVENKIAQLFLQDKIKRRDKLVLKRGLVLEIEKALKI